MKTLSCFLTTAAVGMLSMPAASTAGPSTDGFYIEAPVISVQPLVRLVEVATPREVCWEEPVRHYNPGGRQSHTPKILGAIIGGVVGNQFGSGRGNDVMTAAGALLGGSVGRDVAYERAAQRRGYVSMERRCEIEQTVHQEERVDGYRVTYEYAGQTFETRTRQAPGSTIRVRVSVQPLAYNQLHDITDRELTRWNPLAKTRAPDRYQS